MSTFEVDPQIISSGGTQLTQQADAFAQQLESFKAQIAGFEGAWGGDTIGMIIGTAYTVVAEWAFDCFGAIVEDMAEAGGDLVGMARGFADAEESVTTMFDELGRLLG